LKSIGYNLPSGVIPFRQKDGSFREIVRVSKALGKNLYTLDLMLLSGALEEAWEDRELMGYEGLEVKVISKASLISMKKEAGRPRDLDDVRELEVLGEN
jgi:hypothetical protein